jgi:DNA-binding beta-propeller fold protein YncE
LFSHVPDSAHLNPERTMHVSRLARAVAVLAAPFAMFSAFAGSAVAQVLYFADVDVVNLAGDPDRNAIRKFDLVTAEVHTVVATGDGVRGVAVDGAANKIYWTDVNNFVVRRANLDGTGQQDLVTSGLAFPSAIRLDLESGKLYWGDQTNEEIRRADLTGQNPETSIGGSPFFRGIAIDHAAGKIYWTTSETSTSGKIVRANLDGSNFETIAPAASPRKPSNLALDLTHGKLYWTDSISRVVRRANLDGSNVQDLYIGSEFSGTPKAIALDIPNSTVYWSNDFYDLDSGGFISGAIYSMSLDGADQTLRVAGLGSVNDIAIGPVAAATCRADFNGGGLSVQDIFDYLNAWFAGDPLADFNGGGLAVQDIFDFLNAWFAGCP